jgi:hypothetical protein
VSLHAADNIADNTLPIQVVGNAPDTACKAYTALYTPLTSAGAALSVIRVTDSFDVASVAVHNVALAAPRLSSIKVRQLCSCCVCILLSTSVHL